MNKRLIIVVCMVLVSSVCFTTFFCNAQQAEKEIAENQFSQVRVELEMANSEVLNIDLDTEQEYLQAQSQAEQATEMSRNQMNGELSISSEQSNQYTDSQIQIMEKEEQGYMNNVIQESEQQAAEIEAQSKRMESEMIISE